MSVRILWWGRGDVNYSRNGVVRSILRDMGCEIEDFRPTVSSFGDVEAYFNGMRKCDCVWVPCFRQRDVLAAARWARRKDVPLVFDPLISSWDKRVLEFRKLTTDSSASRRLLVEERRQFAAADIVIADTAEHARFFHKQLFVPKEKLHIVYVGAEENLFSPAPLHKHEGSLEVLFYGSMLPLQGPKTIVEAARIMRDVAVKWTLLGRGPLLDECKTAASELSNVIFEDQIPYSRLCNRIHAADVLLGVFGTSEKAGRVIPNKVFQSLASGRMVITRKSLAYPLGVSKSNAITFVEAGNPHDLAEMVLRFATNRRALLECTAASRSLFDVEFSSLVIRKQLQGIIEALQ